MKVIRAIKKVWDAIFDFFCGDYRVLFGVAVTVGLTVFLTRTDALDALRPFAGAVLVAGVILSFGWSILHEARK